jgi:hypothetical protein
MAERPIGHSTCTQRVRASHLHEEANTSTHSPPKNGHHSVGGTIVLSEFRRPSLPRFGFFLFAKVLTALSFEAPAIPLILSLITSDWIVWILRFIAGGILCAAAFSISGRSSSYYRVRSFETSGKIYERLGVRFFRRFVLHGRYLNQATRLKDPSFQGVRSWVAVQAIEQKGRNFERLHFCSFMLPIPLNCWLFVSERNGAGCLLLLANVVCNFYPVMLHRYTRSRVNTLTVRRARLEFPTKNGQ